jgi:hypothetical protein
MIRRLLLLFGLLAFLFGVVMLFGHHYVAGLLLIVFGLPAGLIPMGLRTAVVLTAWRMPAHDHGTLADPSLRRRLRAAGAVLTLLGLVPSACGIAIETLIWTANHDDPPIPMPLLLLVGLIPAGLLLLLGFALLNAGRLTLAGDSEGVESGFRLGWILFGICVVMAGGVSDGRLFWQVASSIAIPTGVVTLLTGLALRALRAPMEKVRSELWEARNAALREQSIRAGRIKPDQEQGRS